MRNPQVSATVDNGLYSQIEEISKKEKRTMSEMVYLLLQYAVKEKTRKRKGAKEGNT